MISIRKLLVSLDREKLKKYGPMTLFGSVLILILSFFIFRGKPGTKYSRVEGEKEKGSTVSFKNFQKDQYDDAGTVLWKLKADEAYLFAKEKRYVLYGVDFDQYENGKFKSKLTGKKGDINQSKHLIVLEGDIVLRTVENRTLKAKSLQYNEETKELTSNEEVIIDANGTFIRGVGLRADKDLNKFTILRPSAITQGGANPLSSPK
nr:LPS export ABC transporter periplasmic protein LptC [Leptospira wolffii]